MSVFVLVLLLSFLITFAQFSIFDICKLLCVCVKGVILNEDLMMMMMMMMMKPSDGPNTQKIHEIPTLQSHSLMTCNSLVSKLILKKTAKDQGCLGIKGATSPLHTCM